jgi:RimJ/RimL family protein N-acetyltransferase
VTSNSEGVEPAVDFAARHSRIVTLRDGTDIEVRPIVPDDAPMLRAGFEKLSEESRWRRFLRPVTRLTNEEVRYLTEIDYVDHFAWGAQTAGDPPQGIGVARFIRDPGDGWAAEVAVVIADEWQGRGVGTLLLELLVISAGEREIERFVAYVAASNSAGRALLDGLGARGEYAEGLWVCSLELQDATSRIRGTPLYEALTAAAAGRVEFEPPSNQQT